MAMGIEPVARAPESVLRDKDTVDVLVSELGVASLREIRQRRANCNAAW